MSLNTNSNYSTNNTNGSTGASQAAQILGKVAVLAEDLAEKLDKVRKELNKELDVEYVKQFRTCNSSTVIAMRPGILEKATKTAYPIPYNCDDITLIEYDGVTNNILQAVMFTSDKQVMNLVDQNNGIVIFD